QDAPGDRGSRWHGPRRRDKTAGAMTDGGRGGTTAPSNPPSVTRRPASAHGISMQDIELYHGDFEDVAELTRRVWLPEYGGKTWVALPCGALFPMQAHTHCDLCLAAYDGTKLIGS